MPHNRDMRVSEHICNSNKKNRSHTSVSWLAWKKEKRKHDMGKKATGWKQQQNFTLECVLFAI